jgi:hypothetical protein
MITVVRPQAGVSIARGTGVWPNIRFAQFSSAILPHHSDMSLMTNRREVQRRVSRGPQETDPGARSDGFLEESPAAERTSSSHCRSSSALGTEFDIPDSPRVPRPRRQSRRSQNYSRGVIRGRSPVLSNPGLDGFVPPAIQELQKHIRIARAMFITISFRGNPRERPPATPTTLPTCVEL